MVTEEVNEGAEDWLTWEEGDTVSFGLPVGEGEVDGEEEAVGPPTVAVGVGVDLNESVERDEEVGQGEEV